MQHTLCRFAEKTWHPLQLDWDCSGRRLQAQDTLSHSLAVLVGYLITRSVVQPLRRIADRLKDIADQTNLLALNAATEEIGGSIRAIQTETKEAVERMVSGTSQVEVGVDRAKQAGDSLNEGGSALSLGFLNP